MYQSIANTLQVDGLARISGLTQALHRRVLTTEITTPYALTLCCRGKNLKNHKHVQWIEITNCPPTKKTHGYIDAHTQKFRYSVIFMLFTVWLLNLVTVGLEFEKFEPPRTESPKFES